MLGGGIKSILAAMGAILASERVKPGRRPAARPLFDPFDQFEQACTNPDRAAKRRRVRAWGGRRQYLKTIKALRRARRQMAS